MASISSTVQYGNDLSPPQSFTFGQVRQRLVAWMPHDREYQVMQNIAHFILANYTSLKTPLDIDQSNICFIASDPNRSGRGRSFIYDRTLDLFLVLFNKKRRGDLLIGSGSNKKLTFALDPIRNRVYASAGIIPFNDNGLINTELTKGVTEDECLGYDLTKGLHGFMQLVTSVSYISKKYGLKTRFITDYVCGGTLLENFGNIHSHHKKDITVSLLKSLKELHAKKLIHRDLKPSNIVLQKNEDGTVLPLICDLGSVCSLYDRKRRLSCYTSNWWVSPELARTQLHYYTAHQIETHSTEALDLWQLGLILFQLWLNEAPPWFIEGSDDEVYQALCDNDLFFKNHPILKDSDEPIHKLISGLLSNDAKARNCARLAWSAIQFHW